MTIEWFDRRETTSLDSGIWSQESEVRSLESGVVGGNGVQWLETGIRGTIAVAAAIGDGRRASREILASSGSPSPFDLHRFGRGDPSAGLPPFPDLEPAPLPEDGLVGPLPIPIHGRSSHDSKCTALINYTLLLGPQPWVTRNRRLRHDIDGSNGVSPWSRPAKRTDRGPYGRPSGGSNDRCG